MCYAKLCEVTRNRNVVPGDIFPPYRSLHEGYIVHAHADAQVDLSQRWSQRSYYPKSVFQIPASDPPKLGQFPCFLKILTNAALFPEYIWVLPRSKENPGSPIHCSST